MGPNSFSTAAAACLDLVGIGHVGLQDQALAAQLLHVPARAFESGPSTRQQADMSPLSGERLYRGAAHACGRAGDNHHFRTFFTCHVKPPLVEYGRARSVRNMCKHIISLFIRRMADRFRQRVPTAADSLPAPLANHAPQHKRIPAAVLFSSAAHPKPNNQGEQPTTRR